MYRKYMLLLGAAIIILFPTYGTCSAQATTMPNEAAIEELTGNITLAQALEQAQKYNPELSAFSWETRSREARKLQSGFFPNPEIEIESQGIGKTDIQDPLTPTDTFQIKQLVELGNKRSKRVQLASLEETLADWDYKTKQLDVIGQTTKAYTEVLVAQERLSLANELLTLAKGVLDVVTQRVAAGKVSPLEEVRAKANFSTVKIELEQARRKLEATRKILAASWGSSAPSFDKVEGKLEVAEQLPSFEQLSDLALKNPDIARWGTEIQQRQAALTLEQAKSTVDLTLSGGLQSLRGTDETAFVVGISMPIPVFNRNQGGILEAQYKLIKGEEEQRASTLKVNAALAESYQTLAFSFTQVLILRDEILPATQHAFEATNEGYIQGKFRYLDVLDAQRTLFEAKRHYIEALSGYHMAVADTERLTGTKFRK